MLNFVRPALVVALLCSSALAQYKVLDTKKVGGEGGFDYISADSETRQLFVARSGPTGMLHIYNLDTFAETGTVATGSAHGAVADNSNHHGFATSKPVTMFDTQSLKIIKTIDTVSNPDGYLMDEAMHRVYVLSHGKPGLTAIDTNSGDIVGTIDIAGAPEQSVLDGKGHLYMDLEEGDAIAVIDTASLKVTNKYDIKSVGGGCAGLAIDAKNGILFASCRDKNNMIIVNAASGKIITTLPIGVGSDGAVFNPATMEAFSSQGDGTLTVVKENSPTSFVVEQTVKTPMRARTCTIDFKTGHIILQTGEFGPAPAPTTPGGRPGRPQMLPGSFELVVVGK